LNYLKIIIILLFAIIHGLHGEIIVVTSIESTIDNSIDQYKLKSLFTGKDRKINIVVLKNGTTHEAFIKQYVNKTSMQFKQHWKKLLFTGKASLPHQCSDENKMVEYLFKNPNHIGYIHAKNFDPKRLKKLKIKN
jgi:hypothetical protein